MTIYNYALLQNNDFVDNTCYQRKFNANNSDQEIIKFKNNDTDELIGDSFEFSSESGLQEAAIGSYETIVDEKALEQAEINVTNAENKLEMDNANLESTKEQYEQMKRYIQEIASELREKLDERLEELENGESSKTSEKSSKNDFLSFMFSPLYNETNSNQNIQNLFMNSLNNVQKTDKSKGDSYKSFFVDSCFSMQ